MDVSMLITWLCCKGITMLRMIKSKTIVIIDKTFASNDQNIAIFFNSLNFCHLKGDQDDNASVSRGVGQRTLGQQLRGKGRGWRDVDLHNSIFSGIACAQSYLHSCTIACACVWQNHIFSFLVNAILATLVLVVIAI